MPLLKDIQENTPAPTNQSASTENLSLSASLTSSHNSDINSVVSSINDDFSIPCEQLSPSPFTSSANISINDVVKAVDSCSISFEKPTATPAIINVEDQAMSCTVGNAITIPTFLLQKQYPMDNSANLPQVQEQENIARCLGIPFGLTDAVPKNPEIDVLHAQYQLDVYIDDLMDEYNCQSSTSKVGGTEITNQVITQLEEHTYKLLISCEKIIDFSTEEQDMYLGALNLQHICAEAKKANTHPEKMLQRYLEFLAQGGDINEFLKANPL